MTRGRNLCPPRKRVFKADEGGGANGYKEDEAQAFVFIGSIFEVLIFLFFHVSFPKLKWE